MQVAEQYLLMPGHAARLSLVRAGVLGEPTSVQISSTHLYHAVSLIRGLLGVGFESAEVSARAFVAPLADPLSPAGWSGDDSPQQLSTTLATIDFGGRMGLYDFTDNQWWNPLRTRRLVVRGSRGELVDDRVVRLVDPTTPVESSLVRRQTGLDLNLEGLDLKHISFDGDVVYRNPFVGSGMSDDDIAVADIIARTGAWAREEGPAPYPSPRPARTTWSAWPSRNRYAPAGRSSRPRRPGRRSPPAGQSPCSQLGRRCSATAAGSGRAGIHSLVGRRTCGNTSPNPPYRPEATQRLPAVSTPIEPASTSEIPVPLGARRSVGAVIIRPFAPVITLEFAS
ncbi:hypothetical protein NKG94_30425 [Micromonospora sp. M12]